MSEGPGEGAKPQPADVKNKPKHPTPKTQHPSMPPGENEKKLARILAQLGDDVHLLTSLLEGGHLKAEDAYYKVKELWRNCKKAKRELFPELSRDENDH